MVRKLICVVIALVFLVSFVSAQEYSSKIRIKTYPNSDVVLSIVDPLNEDYTFSVLPSSSDKYGDAFIIFTSDDPDQFNFNMRVIVKKGGSRIYPKTGRGVFFDKGYLLGENYDIKVGPEDYDFILTPGVDINDTEQESNVEENVSNESETVDNSTNSAVNDSANSEEIVKTQDVAPTSGTGFSVLGLGTSPVSYGIIAALFVGGALIFFVISRKQKIRIKKDDSSISKDTVNKSMSSELTRAEAKLREAQKEVQKIRNEEKIREARARIAAEEAELRKLRSGKI